MTAIAFGSGIQLLCLGIIGEYIARIYDEVKDRPLYMIDKVLTKKDHSARKSQPGSRLSQTTAVGFKLNYKIC